MKISRRTFLGFGAVFGLAAGANAAEQSKEPPFWRRIDELFPSYADEVTGSRVYNLTPGKETSNQTVYQTHPMWSGDMRRLLFMSNRSGNGVEPHVLDTITGEARPLPGGAGAFTKAIRSNHVYVIRDGRVSVTGLDAAFEEGASPRELAELPPYANGVSGTITVDMDESALYVGTTLEAEKRWALLALDIEAREWRIVREVDFQVGHLQANPFRKGEILFCHETGGDAPQRIWFVHADGKGLQPFYKETYGEWVTHEVWWGPDRIIFTIWPYDDEHKKLPHGVAFADRDSGARGEMTVLSQYDAWHTHGSPDGRLAMGDDFKRNIWIINAATKERRLLTQGHLGEGFKTHPHGSFTPDGKGILFTSSRDGYEALFLARL